MSLFVVIVTANTAGVTLVLVVDVDLSVEAIEFQVEFLGFSTDVEYRSIVVV
jgi:hypothetical protein